MSTVPSFSASCPPDSDTPWPALFESDIDVDLAYELAVEISGAEDGPEHDVLCSFGHTRLPGDRDGIIDASSAEGKSALERVRQKLDAGLGGKLISKFRSLADGPSNTGSNNTGSNNTGPNNTALEMFEKDEAQYKFIILGAGMMGTGAKIEEHDLKHLRRLAGKVQCNETFTLAFGDTAFRGPSKRQFLNALNNYQPGTPRSFYEPSCHTCGKMRQDTGQALLMCSGCKVAWFCDKVSLQTRLQHDGYNANTVI